MSNWLLNYIFIFLPLMIISGCSNSVTLTLSSSLKPPAAFLISETATGSERIAVFWSASKGATSYNVLYKLNSASSFTTASTTALSPAIISGLTAGAVYDVSIQAVNSDGKTLSNIVSVLVDSSDGAPIARDITAANLTEDIQSIITLSYFDVENDQASSCLISSLTDASVTQACLCASGVCTVGITGPADHNGAARFNYTITANGATSNDAVTTLNILPTADAPVVSNFNPPAFVQDSQSMITLPYFDPDNDQASSCLVTVLNNVTITSACDCDAAGVCRVGVTGTSAFSGAASFNFSVVSLGQTSNTAQATFTIGVFDPTMITSDLSSAGLNEDVQEIVTLIYNDSEGDLGTICSVTPMSNITVTQPCACLVGNCTVGVTGPFNYSGAASFAFIVGAGGSISNSSLANLTINPVDDAPLAANINPPVFAEETQSIIGLTYTDVEGHVASACTVTSVTNVTETQICACDGMGICIVGVTGTNNHVGAASFTYTVTANGLTSFAKTASLMINNVDDVPVAAAISPAALDEDIASTITLSYTDVDGGLASACSLSALSNVTITQACACNGAGICTVDVQGTTHYNGAASFNYQVTVTSAQSNSVTASLTISPVDDAPTGANFSPASFIEDAQEIITLPVSDVESHLATACAVANLTNITATAACSCNVAGVCTVGVTGTADYFGTASFSYTVTTNGLTSIATTASLTIIPGDDAPVANDFTASNFTAGTQSIITLSYVDIENEKAGTCTLSNLDDVTITQACACTVAGVCTVGVTGVSGIINSGSFDYTVTANSNVSNVATASFNLICPAGYIEVPAAGATEFCVMKYEAKDDSLPGPGPAVSTATGEPWVSISQDDAITACQAVGIKYDLISNPEWITIAQNIETVPANWDVFATGSINRGHTDGTPAAGLSVTVTTDPYDQTGNSGVWLQKRTHSLSNALEIWDFSGNVFEWVYWSKTPDLKKVTPANKAYAVAAPADDWIEFTSLVNNITNGQEMQISTWEALDPALDSSNGIGRYNSGNNTSGGAAHRGGNWNHAAHAGIYSLSLNQAAPLDSIGFRCVYRP